MKLLERTRSAPSRDPEKNIKYYLAEGKKMKRMFHDADWYYTENFMRELYDEYTDEEKKEFYNNSFEEFITDMLKHEPIEIVDTTGAEDK